MSESVVSYDALKTFFRDCGVGTAGMTHDKLRFLAVMTICPPLFFAYFLADTKNHFPFRNPMTLASKIIKAEMWAGVLYDLRGVLGESTSEDEDDEFNPVFMLAPEYPRWVGVGLYLSRWSERAFDLAKATLTAEPGKTHQSTYMLRKRLSEFKHDERKDEHEHFVKFLYNLLK